MRIPTATYRLQFGPAFGFEEARAVVAYLSELGIGDIYASPILKATQDSTHGYDVTDPTELNPQLGTQDQFLMLAAEREKYGIGWLQDIVPNHMAYSSQNAALMDVFENGPQSEYAEWFDVFRDHPDPAMRTRVLAPFLGAPLEDVLREGQLRLTLDQGGLSLCYYDWRFPVSLGSYAEVLGEGLNETGDDLKDDRPVGQVLRRLCSEYAELSVMPPSDARRERVAEAKRELARLYEGDDAIAAHLQKVLDVYNRTPDVSQRPHPLARLIDKQWFRPVFWKTAGRAINYRRFFYLNDFISLRVQNADVFARVHEKIVQLAGAGLITGLRIDHIDGLYDPLTYLRRLRKCMPDSYLVVEKILELEETLPSQWPIEGTSGYKFCNFVNGLFCDCGSEPVFTDIYHEFLDAEVDYSTWLYEAKLRILQQHMAGEVVYLSHLIIDALGEDGDESMDACRGALTALMAAFPVYRTYIDAGQFADRDRAFITAAIQDAKKRAPDHQEYIDRIGRVLLSYQPLAPPSAGHDKLQYVVMRFQQFTGPAMAKGLEDTLFYTYNRFISLNEVGGDPNCFGIPLEHFHRFNEMRARHWPHAMNATSTHDAKRGEDVRARLNVLSEMPERWREAVSRWARINAAYKQMCDGGPVPDANDEYFLYQTLVGALPFDEKQYDRFKDRLKDYTVKALREAKRRTTWSEPNQSYEHGCLAFIDHVFDRDRNDAFWQDFLSFQEAIITYGLYNSLSQTTLKITCPGLPDFYQGTEMLDLNLVDPDNRRPVDFAVRKQFLMMFRKALPGEMKDIARRLLAPGEHERVKLFLIYRLLRARATFRTVFEGGDYLPLDVAGRWARHAIVFLRTDANNDVLVVAPRFTATLVRPGELPMGRRVWRDTYIRLSTKACGLWHNLVTDERLHVERHLRIGDVLTSFPIGVLRKKTNVW